MWKLIPWFGLCISALAETYPGNLPIDHPAIRYSEQPVSGAMAKAVDGIEFRDDLFGYLPDLLKRLNINIDSQMLVFSKTSFQGARVSPDRPRAIYFNDRVAVGWVPGAPQIEIAVTDTRLGAVFYTLNATKQDRPHLVRQESCLKCHQGPATAGVPGIFVGSVFPNALGVPQRAGAIITDHRTPFRDRWGGWYVTAGGGQQMDRSNAFAANPSEPMVLDIQGKQNLQDLSRMVRMRNYLAPTSDIVALMTFEHQTLMTNLLTRLSWEARIAQQNGENEAAILHHLRPQITETVAELFFEGEASIIEPIRGVSSFVKTFPLTGLRDSHGRSLRDFDLTRRLFRYPLSYMVDSSIFDALPEFIQREIFRYIDTRLNRLPAPKDAAAVRQILQEIKPLFN